MTLTDDEAIEALYAAAHWLLNQARPSDAAQVFRAMTQLRPEDERAWLGLGLCHEEKGQLRIAAELYRLAQAAGAGGPRTAIARGRVLRELGEREEAEACFASAHAEASERGEDALAALAAYERSGP